LPPYVSVYSMNETSAIILFKAYIIVLQKHKNKTNFFLSKPLKPLF